MASCLTTLLNNILTSNASAVPIPKPPSKNDHHGGIRSTTAC